MYYSERKVKNKNGGGLGTRVDHFQYDFGLIRFTAILFGKLSKSPTSLAKVYSTSLTPAAVLGLFDLFHVQYRQRIKHSCC